MRVVVCEDDVTLRSLLSSLLEEGGDEIIAESDNAMEALELTRRFRPDVLLLDHAIRAGTGLDVVVAIAADPELDCRVVLFTSFVAASQVRDFHFVTLVDKPDFDRLKVVLDEIRVTGGVAASVERRRPPSRPIDHVPGQREDDDPLKFFAVLSDVQPGDSLLLVAVDDPSPDELDALADAGRATIRAQDWLVQRSKYVAMLLVGGTPESATRVVERMRRSWDASAHAERELRVASAIFREEDSPSGLFERVAAMVVG
jgi:CheY-like chemotaxis protein